MANYRLTTIYGTTTQTAAATEIIDINMSNLISRIEIYLKRTAVGYVMSAHPAADITRIELLDGSDVLVSLTGYEAQALNIYDRQCATQIEGQLIDANGIYSRYGIDFGRFLYDKELALDPTKFDNLQLRITHTMTSCSSACVTGEMTVVAWVFDEKKITPMGFLSAKEIVSYTCGDENSYKYIDLPTNYPIRKILLRGYYTGTQPADSIKEFKIDENMEENVLYDMNSETYFTIMRGARWKPVVESINGLAITGELFWYVTPTGYWTTIAFSPLAESEHLFVHGWGAAGKVDIRATTTSSAFIAIVSGYLPNSCFEIPFGDSDDLTDWYDVTKKRNVRLRLKSGGNGTNGTAQVVLQQYRTY